MLNELNDREKDVVRRALIAALDGPFFPDWEFQTIFGVNRIEMRSVVEAWPDLSLQNRDHVAAVSNAFNNLTGYPIKASVKPLLLSQYGLDEASLEAIFARLRPLWKEPAPS